MKIATMIAGPNGSGKTTLTAHLFRSGIDLGRYINPDVLAETIAGDERDRVSIAQQFAEILRDDCIARGASFSFETVMSHPSKLEVLRRAKAAGFMVVVYFIATTSPAINIHRVANRVALGGHGVPEDKIVARYQRTLELLPLAIDIADRAVLFDNSGLHGTDHGGLRIVATVQGRDGDRHLVAYPPLPDWAATALSATGLLPSAG